MDSMESVIYDASAATSTFSADVVVNQTNSDVQISSWLYLRYFFGTLMAIVILVTLVGNCLVVLAVCNFRRLRTVTNYLIVSLATADVTVSVFVMPYALLYEMVQTWRFGWIFCYFFNSCDVMCCTASILHLCMISLDRYFAITDPLRYNQKMSKARTFLMIALAWICSALISFVPIYSGWFLTAADTVYEDSPECNLNVNRIYAIVSSCTSFYIPLLVMVFAYARIFLIARDQSREIAKQERSLHVFKNSDEKKKLKAIHKDSKAIKTLGTIMGIFIVSWLPFFLMYLIMPFCDNCYLPRAAVSGITWLGYANSFMNPIIYAVLNKDFSVAFRRLLYCRRTCVNRDSHTEVVSFTLDRRNGQNMDDSYSSAKRAEFTENPALLNHNIDYIKQV